MQYADAQPGATGAGFSLAEELLLLGIDPERGKLAVERRYLRWGLAAAAIVELEAAGRVAEDRGRIMVVPGPPTGFPHLDDALSALEQERRSPVRIRRWLDLYGQRAEEIAVSSLAARGAIHAETRHALGVFPVRTYRVFATQPRDQRLGSFHSWAKYGPGDRRSRALAALFKATKLARKLGVPRAVRKEMRPLVEEFWPVRALRKKVAAAQSSGGGGGDGGGGCGGGG